MRALGYPNSYEFRKAWEANDPDFYERDRLARIKLLAKFGVISTARRPFVVFGRLSDFGYCLPHLQHSHGADRET